MKLRRYFLIGISGTVIGLIAMILLVSQLLLINNFQLLEAQDAKTQIQRVVDSLNNEIDTFQISDINWTVPPPPRPPPSADARGKIDVRLVEKISVDTGSTVTLVLDRDNNIVFRNVAETGRNQNTPSKPVTLFTSVQTESLLANASNTQRPIRGLMTLPEGPMMILCMPLPGGDGRIIWGRYFDAAEVQHLSELTHPDLRTVAFDEPDTPADFQRAKVNLDNDDSFYVEAKNEHTLSGYTVINDVFGKPSVILRIQMPRTIYQVGQSGLTNFALVLIVCVIGIGAAAYLLLEQGILSPLATLNTNLTNAAQLASTNYKIDEFNKLAAGMQNLTTARTAVEEKLQESYARLESRVSERTSELFTINTGLQQQLDATKQTQTMLVDARDKALEALHVRSQLLANVSHDARTPLTIISLNTEMLQQGRHGDMNPKQNEVLDRILIATRQLFNFMTNMLGESQLSSGKIPLVKVVFEPKLLVEDLVSMLKPLAENKAIEIRAEVDLALPSKTMGDPDRLKQIITNLCENAVKFTRTGEVLVKAYRSDQYKWVIEVKDTGCGIPSEAQIRIFEPYWQLENAGVTNASRGVGLGLSIVKQLVQLMNGTITVKSEIGKGTTFTVVLPIEPEPVRAAVTSFETTNLAVIPAPENPTLEPTQSH